MFYLKIFVTIFKNDFLKSSLLFFSFFLSLNVALFNNKIADRVLSSVSEEKSKDYFNLLIEADIDKNKLAHKIYKLPGIEKVYFKSQKKLENKVRNVLENLSIEVPSAIKNSQFHALEVAVHQNFDENKLPLVKEYLDRVFGTEKVTIGELKKNTNSLKQNNVFYQNIPILLIALSLTFLILIFMGQSSSLFKQAYLIEHFQRRKKSFEISFALGFFLLSFLNIAVGYFYFKASTISAVTSLGISFFFILVSLLSYQIKRSRI